MILCPVSSQDHVWLIAPSVCASALTTNQLHLCSLLHKLCPQTPPCQIVPLHHEDTIHCTPITSVFGPDLFSACHLHCDRVLY